MASTTTTTHEARHAAQTYLNTRLTTTPSTTTTSSTTSPFTIPIIDLSPSIPTATTAAAIHHACTTSGFFHIINHGITPHAQTSILTAARRFFHELDPAQKEALHVRHSKYMRGWEPAEYTYVNPADWNGKASGSGDAGDGGEVVAIAPETKEGFNWGYEAGLDPMGGAGGEEYRELDGAVVNGNVWPAEGDLPGFYDSVREYYGEVLGLARRLFGLFALSLGLEEGYFDGMITHPGAIGRLLYYPAAKVGEEKEEVGLGAHSDYECFTILLSSAVSGLEILSPTGEWVKAPPVEGGLVVNIADFLMRWTNDRYKSTIHRVVNRSKDERYSVPIFISINYDQVVETLPSCITGDTPSKYPPIRAGEYILERLRATAKED